MVFKRKRVLDVNKKYVKTSRKIISFLMIFVMLFSYVDFSSLLVYSEENLVDTTDTTETSEATETTETTEMTETTETDDTIKLYLMDNTAEGWLKNDDAVFDLVDNTNGHDYYRMTKVNDTLWVATVPASVYNITFNGLSPTEETQWNSWKLCQVFFENLT